MVEENKGSNDQFPIRELSVRTQVNTVTLRAWERRYGLLTPERTEKGHRLYSNDDVALVEKILMLVARGVPLGKVKPLIDEDLSLGAPDDGSQIWESSVAKLLVAVESFSLTKVAHLLHESFSSYPAPLCRERLLEPVFGELAQRNDSGATFGFAESELIRYATVRLSAKVPKKNQGQAVTLIAGHQASLWRLSLMALELADSKFKVQLLHGRFTLAAAVELTRHVTDMHSVFYQDGVWKEKEQALAAAALSAHDTLFLCGTASALAGLEEKERVFADVAHCCNGLRRLG